MATGNFSRIFGEVELPPLPAAALRLVDLAQDEDASLAEAGEIVATDPALSGRVLKLVNSAAFGIPSQVGDVRQAVALLGLSRTRSLAVGLGVLQVIPKPEGQFFRSEEFWRDSLAKGIFAGALAQRACPNESGEAFSGGLLQNMALPVLLTEWGEYYQPILEIWRDGDESLAALETEAFGWNHAEAAAWMAKSWNLPDVLVCCLGLHHASRTALDEKGLGATAVEAVALSSALPGEIRPTDHEAKKLCAWVTKGMGLSASELASVLVETEASVRDTARAFGLNLGDSWGLRGRLASMLSGDAAAGGGDES